MNRPMKRRNRKDDAKTTGSPYWWDKDSGYLTYWLSGIRRIGGANLAQAWLRNRRSSCAMPREKAQTP